VPVGTLLGVFRRVSLDRRPRLDRVSREEAKKCARWPMDVPGGIYRTWLLLANLARHIGGVVANHRIPFGEGA
jgi:hypothetical protein